MSNYTTVTKTSAIREGAERRSPSMEDASLFSMKTAHSVLLTTPVRTRWVHSVGAESEMALLCVPSTVMPTTRKQVNVKLIRASASGLIR